MRSYILIFILSLAVSFASASPLELKSPDGNTKLTFETGLRLSWSVYYKGITVLENSATGLSFSQEPELGRGMNVTGSSRSVHNESWKPVFGVHDSVIDNYNELKVSLREEKFPRRELTLVFRAYNDGIAFRYLYPEQHNVIPAITAENTTYRFTSDHETWMADYGGYYSHQEAEFKHLNLTDAGESDFIGLPLVVKISESCFAAITEAGIDNWAGFYLAGCAAGPGEGVTLRTRLSPPPGGDENSVKVTWEGENWSPWRVVMLADTPGSLAESEIIMNLNPPCALDDVSWIKPGKCAWDHWWSGEVKMDTETIKKYIQFASETGFPYMLIDWQWYGEFNTPSSDITKVNPAVDMPEVLRFAKEKNVKCWLWLYWTDAERKYLEAFPLYEKWGIAGVKIDFMASDHQKMVKWYHKIVKAAADNHLMVNFHGAYKPDGFRRTYPNLMTREGVMGNEYSKWSTRITPEHNVTLAFTRMLAGPMDYTPGGFLNRTPENFKTGVPANVMNTRCQQLAMFVVYNSPITTVCDDPEHYRGQPGLEFLKQVPVVWDDMKVLDGYPGEFVAIAKRSGREWYIGVINNSEARDITLDMDFLGHKGYTIDSWADAPDSDTDAEKLVPFSGKADLSAGLKVRMAPGGGYAAILRPIGN